jgi:hypothetical protein
MVEEFSSQDLSQQLDRIQDTISSMKGSLSLTSLAMLEIINSFQVLMEHHETVHKDCELLGEV